MEQTIFQSCHYSILSKTFYTTEKWGWTPTFKDVAIKATDRADEDTSLLQLRQRDEDALTSNKIKYNICFQEYHFRCCWMHPPNCVLNCQGASLQRKWFFLSVRYIVGRIALWRFKALPDHTPNKHNPTFNIVFHSTAAASSFLHNHIKFYLSPKFLNKGCDWYQWGVTAFAFKADVVVCNGY